MAALARPAASSLASLPVEALARFRRFRRAQIAPQPSSPFVDNTKFKDVHVSPAAVQTVFANYEQFKKISGEVEHPFTLEEMTWMLNRVNDPSPNPADPALQAECKRREAESLVRAATNNRNLAKFCIDYIQEVDEAISETELDYEIARDATPSGEELSQRMMNAIKLLPASHQTAVQAQLASATTFAQRASIVAAAAAAVNPTFQKAGQAGFVHPNAVAEANKSLTIDQRIYADVKSPGGYFADERSIPNAFYPNRGTLHPVPFERDVTISVIMFILAVGVAIVLGKHHVVDPMYNYMDKLQKEEEAAKKAFNAEYHEY